MTFSLESDWWPKILNAVRRRDWPQARRVAMDATGVEPSDARPWLALAVVARAMGDRVTARHSMDAALDRYVVQVVPAGPRATRVLVLVPIHIDSIQLGANGGFSTGGSVDWQFFLAGRFHQEIVPVQVLSRYPSRIEALRARNELVVNLIADPDSVGSDLQAALGVVSRLGLPVINHPAHVMECGRTSNYVRLRDIEGLTFPVTWDLEVPRRRAEAVEALAGAGAKMGYPFLLRPAGWHDGFFLQRIDHPRQLERAHLAAGGGRYHMIRYHDCRGSDGLYRKLRLFCIAGVWFPRHLLVGTDWNVRWKGYRDLLLSGKGPSFAAEEESFLRSWPLSLPRRGHAALKELYQRVRMDWFGLDCVLSPSGDLLVFEVNPAMSLAANEPSEFLRTMLAFQRPYREAIIDATRRLIDDTALGARSQFP